MTDHRQRVLAERADLHDKINRLGAFIDGESYQTLPKNEQALLFCQHVYMTLYRGILDDRIAAFEDTIVEGSTVRCVDASDRYGWKDGLTLGAEYTVARYFGSQIVLVEIQHSERTFDADRFVLVRK